MDLLDVTEETIPLDKVEGKLAEASETLGVNPSVFANITYSSNPVRVAEVQSKVLEILSSR